MEPETTTTTTTPAGAQTPPSVDWEARFKGLSTRYNEEVGRLTGELSRFQSEATTYKGKAAELETKYGEATKTLEAITNARDKALSETATLQDVTSRLQTLATEEFRDLIPLNDKGLLKTDLKGDEYKAYLAKFKETLASQKPDQKTGFTPATPASRKGAKKADLWQEALKAQREGNMTAYDALYTEYLAAKE